MTGGPAGLNVSEDGTSYTYVCPSRHVKGTEGAPYTATLACDPSQGIEVTAGGSEYAIRLVPLIPSLAEIRRKEDDLAYRAPDGSLELAYQFKRNGLKEDIVLSHPAASGEAISFRMRLDPMLEAKRDGRGNILVYGPDSVLSGFIQAGDDTSARLVMKARQAAPKTSLLYVIPAPTVLDAKGHRFGNLARYELDGDSLTIRTADLSALPGPVTIDPSIVVSTTADFEAGNDEGMISFDTDAISRAAPSSGMTGVWSGTTNFPVARSGHASVAYAGHLYVIGGYTGSTCLNDVEFAPINPDGTVGAWSATTSFSTGRRGHTSVAYNGCLYVIGGRDDSAVDRDDVQFAPINADGTLGSWSVSTPFTTGRYGHASVAYDGYLYIIGGAQTSFLIPLSDVQAAPIRADGTTGAWSVTTGIPAARYYHASVAYNGFLYVIGGHGTGGTLFSDVQAALIGADGSLGTWSATASFQTARSGHTSIACNGYLYVLGGWDGSSYFGDVQYAPIHAGGQVGPWAATTSLAAGRKAHASAAYNGRLYAIGGQDGTGTLSDVQVAPVLSNVSSGSWTATTSLPARRKCHASVVYNGYLYVLGGLDAYGTRTNDVLFASIHADGTIGAWGATTSFPTPENYHTSVAYNGYLYVIGGLCDGGLMSQIAYAPINSDGTVGAWAPTTNFPTARYSHTSVVVNGYLYVIGGTTGGAYFSDVQFAPINSNGTVGTWSATTSLTTGRAYHTSVAYNGYLYVLGGWNNPFSYVAVVQVAPINADGTVGAWSATTSLPTPLMGHTSVALNGYMYVLGGDTGSSYLSDVHRAPILAGGHLGAWSDVPSFANGRFEHTSVVCNGCLYVIAGSGASDYNDVQYAPTGSGGTVGAWSATTSFVTARENHTSVAYDGYLYVLGGRNGSTYLNDIQYAPVHADGTVGAWSPTTSFTTGRDHHTSVAYKSYLYVIGGHSGSSWKNDVQFAPINSDGTVGSFSATSSLPTAPVIHESVAHNGYLYVIGGMSEDVLYAQIHADGTVGAWSAATSLPSERRSHASVAYNGVLYVIGGWNSGNLASVLFTPIHSDGTVGAWSATRSLPVAKSFHTSVACNGYLYVIGGEDDYSLPFADVLYAPINSDGTVGDWEFTTSLPTARSRQASAAYNGFLYVLGGVGGPLLNEVLIAPVKTPAAKAAYSKLLDLGSDQVMESLQFDSTAGRTGTVNLTYAVAPQSTAVFGARTTIPGATSGTPYATGPSCGRWLWVRLDLDDTNSASVDSGGALGRMDILDLTLTYDSLSGIGNSLDAHKTAAVHLTWTADPEATSYNLNRCDATGGHCTPSLLGNTANLSWDDSVLGNTKQYWYTVQSVNGECVSP